MMPLRWITWLRARKRGFKFTILLLAAWAPLLLSAHMLLAGALMSVATALFWAATSSEVKAPPDTDDLRHEPP